MTSDPFNIGEYIQRAAPNLATSCVGYTLERDAHAGLTLNLKLAIDQNYVPSVNDAAAEG